MDKITFMDCLRAAITNDELISNYNRLSGEKLGATAKLSPIERLVDQATGHDASTVKDEDIEAMRRFVAFVKDAIWHRLPTDSKDNDCWMPPDLQGSTH